MKNYKDIFTNNPDQLIRLGNNNDKCYVCNLNAIKDLNEQRVSATEGFKVLKALEGVFLNEPMLKLRVNGNDICICQEHLEELSNSLKEIKDYRDSLIEESTKNEEVKEEVKEDKKSEKKENKKQDKKEEKKNDKKEK